MRVEAVSPERARLRVVQQGTVRSRQGINLPGVKLSAPALGTDKTSGETHRRHHVTKDGFYRGRQVIAPKTKVKDVE